MPPTKDLSDPVTRKVRLVISSADRNLTSYPSPSKYVVKFDQPYTDVSSLTLISAQVPLTAYQISDSNNVLTFRLSQETFTALIPHGDYEPPPLLAEAIQDAMNKAANLPGLFKVTYVPFRDHFSFSSFSSFHLLFDGGLKPYGPQIPIEFGISRDEFGIAGDRSITYPDSSIAKAIGFGPKDYEAQQDAMDYVLNSEFRRDATKKVAVIYVDGADVNHSLNDAFNRSYVVIGDRQAELAHWLPDRQVTKSYNPPQGSLAEIRIRINDINGKPYDCQNHDHRLEFLLTTTPRYQHRPNWTVRAE